MMIRKSAEKKSPWLIALWIFLGIFFFFMILLVIGIVSFFFSSDSLSEEGNVAVITVEGAISVDGLKSYIETGASSKKIIKLIEKAEEDGMDAIIFDINSPGGSAVASYEVAEKISSLRSKNITTVAVIHEVGASGAYWIASATDHIIANELSMTGSIGVISSYLTFNDFLERYNVTYQRLVAGKFKDAGTPFKELTSDERALFQEKINLIHDVFIQEVAKNRHLDEAEVRKLATGFVYLGLEAKDNGLVDELGGVEEAKAYIKTRRSIDVKIVEYKDQSSLLSLFSEVASKQSFSVGQGIGSMFIVADAPSVLV